MHLTYRYRVKDKHAARLNKMAAAVSMVWNYCNEAQVHAAKWGQRWPTAFDLHRQTAGTSKELGLSATAINAICTCYVQSRVQAKRAKLRWRGKKSLGWVPVKSGDVSRRDSLRVMGVNWSVWFSRPLPAQHRICDGGCFSQDAKGNWYLNLVIEVPNIAAREPERRVGIDLGLKDFAALSTGETVPAQRIYRRAERALAKAQRAGKKKLAVAKSMKGNRQRLDFHHKLALRLVREFDFIAVGDVSASKLAKTRMAKSVLDAGWSSFRRILAYKAIAHGARYTEVDERYSTQACSDCGAIGGPKGRQGLVIRVWTCSSCGAVHDRDTNSANFILHRGLAMLIEEPTQRLAA